MFDIIALTAKIIAMLAVSDNDKIIAHNVVKPLAYTTKIISNKSENVNILK
ncbi:MAG: hypothetical protein MR024_00065 [Firmicutes bacterium]|nr:hypothetical protein [Bacillota bacterium]